MTVKRPGYVEFEEQYSFARGEHITIRPRWVLMDDVVVEETPGQGSDQPGAPARREVEMPTQDIDHREDAAVTPPANRGEMVTERVVVEPPPVNPLDDLPSALPLPTFRAGAPRDCAGAVALIRCRPGRAASAGR